MLRETGELVGMGRVIGDGGWYFHVADMCVSPEHQRRGIGDAVLTRLIDGILAAAPGDPYITLLADPPGRALYRRHGFVESAPDSLGHGPAALKRELDAYPRRSGVVSYGDTGRVRSTTPREVTSHE